MRRKRAGKKGQVTMYVVFMIFAILILLVMTVMFPLGVRINTQFYAAGEKIILSSNESLSQIQNTTVRDSIRTQMREALDNTQENININYAFFKYSGYIMIGIVAVAMFLLQRRLVEMQGGGGGYFS